MTQGGVRKRLVGTVVSDRMDKTALVLVNRLTRHPVYKKYIRKTRKYMTHDPLNQCKVGDKVQIIESRPLSKHKRWQVVAILEKGNIEA